MKRMLLLLTILCGGAFLWTPALHADGCYICGPGSSDACRDYCRYSGSESFDNRKKCEKAGCKVTGTASCPTAVNYKVCQVFQERSISEFLLAYFGSPR